MHRDEQEVTAALLYLMNRVTNLESYIQVLHAPEARDYGFDWYPKHTTSLYVLASLGVYLAQGLSKEQLSVVNSLQQTPLHIASKKGHAAIVQSLLDQGADPVPSDDRGFTSLCWAVWEGQLAVVKLFLGLEQLKGSLLTCRTHLDESLLHLALHGPHLEIAQLLIQHGIDLDLVNHDNDTALHIAARMEQNLIVRALLEGEASTNLTNSAGFTACDESRFAGLEDIVKVFGEYSIFPTLTMRLQDVGNLDLQFNHWLSLNSMKQCRYI